jgi:hypothetical protein
VLEVNAVDFLCNPPMDISLKLSNVAVFTQMCSGGGLGITSEARINDQGILHAPQ